MEYLFLCVCVGERGGGGGLCMVSQQLHIKVWFLNITTLI